MADTDDVSQAATVEEAKLTVHTPYMESMIRSHASFQIATKLNLCTDNRGIRYPGAVDS